MDAPPNPGVQSGPDVLDGWKDIASYLGRSPRSVQRWERDLGLPVHRIPTPDGGTIVYGLRSELDAWRSRQSEGAGTSPALADPAPSLPLEKSPPAPAGALETAPVSASPAWPLRRLRRWLSMPVPAWTAVAAAGATLAAILMAGSALPVGGVPTTWEFEGRELHTFTDGGRPLWTHTFDRVVSRPRTIRGVGARTDVNGDGGEDILVPVRYAAAGGAPSESDAVVAFEADGSVLWTVQPRAILTWGDETFTGPWHVYDIASGMTPEGPRSWIAYSHHTWWPGLVVEVTPDGEQRLRYVQPGRIYSLTYWPTATRILLMAGGTLNEESSASVAFVDLDGPPARWAGKAPTPSCSGCPETDPAAMLLIPTSDVTKALFRPYGWVLRGTLLNPGVELATNDGFGWGSIVTVSEDLEVTSFARSDQYWQVHQDLEGQGRMTHAAAECPDRFQPIEVRKWEPATAWSTMSVRLRRSIAPADIVE